MMLLGGNQNATFFFLRSNNNVMELTNGENDESQNVIWKCNVAFLQVFRDNFSSFGWQSAYLLSGNKNWHKRFGDTKL